MPFQWHSQEFSMRGLWWGYGSRASSRQRQLGFWQSPQLLEARGLEAKPPVA